MELIVEGKGAFVGKHQGRLRVTRPQQSTVEMPLIHLKHVVIVGSGVSLSVDRTIIGLVNKRFANAVSEQGLQ